MFFILSKCIWALLIPEFFFLLLGLLGLLFKKWAFPKCGTWMCALSVLFFVVMTFMPLGTWGAFLLERPYPPLQQLPQHVDGIIMLGGSELSDLSNHWKQGQLSEHGERYLGFAELATRYPEAKLVFSGGSGRLFPGQVRENHIAKDLHRRFGIDVERILYEGRSRNTYENCRFSKELVEPKQSEKWLLVTSAFHMRRSHGVFAAQGWNTIPFPVDFNGERPELRHFQPALARNLGLLGTISKEFLGTWVYQFTGKCEPVSLW